MHGPSRRTAANAPIGTRHVGVGPRIVELGPPPCVRGLTAASTNAGHAHSRIHHHGGSQLLGALVRRGAHSGTPVRRACSSIGRGVRPRGRRTTSILRSPRRRHRRARSCSSCSSSSWVRHPPRCGGRYRRPAPHHRPVSRTTARRRLPRRPAPLPRARSLAGIRSVSWRSLPSRSSVAADCGWLRRKMRGTVWSLRAGGS